MTTWSQWLPLVAIFGIVAGLYYLAKWFEVRIARTEGSKGKKKDREVRRKEMREKLEDKLWLRNERRKILEELKKKDEG